MSTVKVRVSELVDASMRQLEESARRSDLVHGELSTRLRTLPPELKDRFVSYREETGATVLVLTALLDDYAEYVADSAHKADADDDGFLSPEDVRALPRDLQDTFRACLWNAPEGEGDGALDASPRDVTPAGRREAQGADAVAYEDAARRAVRALIVRDSSPSCARTVLRQLHEQEGAYSEARLDLALRQGLDSGTLELMPDEPSNDGKAWVFRVVFGAESELAGAAFLVEVDRTSGRAATPGAAA